MAIHSDIKDRSHKLSLEKRRPCIIASAVAVPHGYDVHFSAKFVRSKKTTP